MKVESNDFIPRKNFFIEQSKEVLDGIQDYR